MERIMEEDIIKKAAEVIKQNCVNGGEYTGQNCVLSLIDLEDFPTASVITPSRSAGIETIWFCTGLGGDKIKRIKKNNRACVCFGAAEYNISLVGEIEVITDANVKKEQWYKALADGHFSSDTDPNYCVLKFTTKRYNLLVDWKETRGHL